jgi:hypothetical protein
VWFNEPDGYPAEPLNVSLPAGRGIFSLLVWKASPCPPSAAFVPGFPVLMPRMPWSGRLDQSDDLGRGNTMQDVEYVLDKLALISQIREMSQFTGGNRA